MLRIVAAVLLPTVINGVQNHFQRRHIRHQLEAEKISALTSLAAQERQQYQKLHSEFLAQQQIIDDEKSMIETLLDNVQQSSTQNIAMLNSKEDGDKEISPLITKKIKKCSQQLKVQEVRLNRQLSLLIREQEKLQQAYEAARNDVLGQVQLEQQRILAESKRRYHQLTRRDLPLVQIQYEPIKKTMMQQLHDVLNQSQPALLNQYSACHTSPLALLSVEQKSSIDEALAARTCRPSCSI